MKRRICSTCGDVIKMCVQGPLKSTEDISSEITAGICPKFGEKLTDIQTQKAFRSPNRLTRKEMLAKSFLKC